MQSAAKPAVGGLLGQQFSLAAGNDGSSEDEDSEVRAGAMRGASPSLAPWICC